MTATYRLGDLVNRFGGSLSGDPGLMVSGFAGLDTAVAGQLSFLANPKYRSQLAATHATAALVRAGDAEAFASAGQAGPALWVCADPYLHFARIAQFFAADGAPERPAGIAMTAAVHPGARVHATAWIAHGAVIEEGAVIGPRASVGAGCVVGRNAGIGEDSLLHPRVVIYEGCTVGARCILHSGAVIGADGFGFARDGATWVKIPQTGAVVIGDDVEIGANTTIDRGALADTVIGNGVKLDNQIQIGHNVRIGDHTAMAGCVGIAGSARIGQRCTVGGGAIILGHLVVGDDVNVSAGTVVTHSLPTPGHYTGLYPVADNAAWEKSAAALKRLPDLRARLRSLERDRAPRGASASEEDHNKNTDKDPS